MTAEEFKRAAVALYGVNWPLKLFADDLGVSERAVRRWVAGEPEIPAGVEAEITDMLRQRRALINELLGEVG